MVSLDVFRGMAIAGMILVNNPGSWDDLYGPLKHADWNGWTLTDLIFPFFLFIAGVSLTLSFESRLELGASRRAMGWRLLRRSALLFAIGFLLNWLGNFDLHSVRIMGVLQRIALCYLAGDALYLWTPREPRKKAAAIAGVAVLLLVGYWALMTFVPVPGYGAGHLDKDNNLAAFIDRAVMGGHLWSESKTWDPEGFLSTLPAIATILIGILSGIWIRESKAKRRAAARTIAGLAIAGGALIGVGWLLNPYFPINKNLWTSTFALFAGGWALLFLALCYGVVDVLGWRRWTGAFLVFGRNAIVAYALSELLAIAGVAAGFKDSDGDTHNLQDWIYQAMSRPFGDARNASLCFAVCFVLFILALLWPLHQRNLHIRI